MDIDLYTYKAKVISVYDGDTVTLEIDLGMHIKVQVKGRLLGIDTPELRGKERVDGLKARDYVRELILDQDIYVKTKKDKTGKYGRWLVTIYLEDGTDLNQHLIDKGMAQVYMR